MRKYRYRTAVLTGPWRESEDQALADAARAHQAEKVGDQVEWVVPGRIEESVTAEPVRR